MVRLSHARKGVFMFDNPREWLSLPDGWNWPRVERARAEHGIAAHLVPIGFAPGVITWASPASIFLCDCPIGSRWDTGSNVYKVAEHLPAGRVRVVRIGDDDTDSFVWHYSSLTHTTTRRVS